MGSSTCRRRCSVIEARPGRSLRGFSLLEALIALALVGLALLLDLGLQAQSREIEARLAAESDLLRRAEATIESVRAGVHPLRSGPVDPVLAWPTVADPALSMMLVVDPTGVPGLCRVMLHGQTRARRGRPHDIDLDTLVWQPSSSCL
jgi:prepilin-type N-terminal cleavage/methylation domain-containing protein